MAMKKTTRKARSKSRVKPPSKKPGSQGKAASKRKATRRRIQKTSRKSAAKPRAKTVRVPTRRSRRHSKRLKPNEHLEKMTVAIEKQKSGDLVVTESLGGSIRVHHTVHPESVATPIPGKSYKELKKLGPGTHEVSVKRTIDVAHPPAVGSVP